MKTLTKLLPMLALLGCASCAAELETPEEEPSPITWDACSQAIPDHPCDMTLLDQNGEDWNLYEHYGSIIILDFSAEWCGYCHLGAETVQEIQDEYADDNVVYVTVLIEDRYGEPASVALAEHWANTYGIQAPVLAGSRELISEDVTQGWPVTGWPRYFFIDRDMTLVHAIAGYNDDTLRNVLDTLIQESEVTAE